MPKDKPVRQTIVIIPEDEELAEVSTFNRRWINRMEKLTDNEQAQEVEASIEGAREWQFPKSMIKLPFNRLPREWTAEQRQEARERLAAVREAVQASKAPVKKGKLASKKAAAPEPTKTLVKTGAKSKAPAAPAKKVVVHADRHEVGKTVGGKKLAKQMDEDDETQFLDEDEEIEEEEIEEEEEEVVVKKAPAKKVIKRH